MQGSHVLGAGAGSIDRVRAVASGGERKGEDDGPYWRDLREALARVSAAMNGFGEARLRVIFIRGIPRMVFTDGSEAHFKLGNALAPLTGHIPAGVDGAGDVG